MYVKLLTNNFLSEKAVGKSESKDVHLAVLRVLPEVIRESVDAERHADYRKGEGGKGTEGERRDAGRIVAVNQGKRDGSGVDVDASSKSVIVYDPATGEKKMVSPTAVDGIESLGEVKTAEQREAEINAHMQDTIQRSKDWLEGNVANPVGMQIQLGDGRIATIEAMHEDGKSAIATLPDGTQFLVPNDVLQRIVNNGQYADYQARRDAEARNREAEQSTESAPETATEGGQSLPEEASPKEESREYAQGDVFDVVVDGNKMHAEIVSPKDADGRFVVNVDDGESMRTLYVTPEELAAMEYREEPSPKAEETKLATEDSSDKALERGAQPTEEHAPTALERIPRDEKGNAQFHDVDTETAWDGLVEMSGNEETAHKVAEASLANAERKLKAAKALKEKGETPEELLQSIKENEAAVAEAQRTVDAWKAIVGEKARREEAAKAEAERIATEKAEAERKAAEERERAEKEEKTRIEAEKKEAERIAAEKAEEEARVEAERKAEEERKTKEEERKERDENGQPFVVSSDGTTTFGEITEDTGLTAAPIKLSEGVADEKGNGYGLRHIEARHGDQIRKAGFSSVEEFIEQVAKNYDVIKEGSDRNGNKTYRLLLTDKHNNTLMIELSKDGSYWNVNTAGVFKKSYGKDKKEVYNRHTTVKQSAETAETSQADEHSGTQSTSRMNVPTTSADKGSEKPEKKQEKQSVFDKAKEIADKEEKKRKAEAEKPKQKPLTEAERKDAEEVAGALGYRVEWVDTMAENGTIDADKKVIRIAKDAENPLVQVLGHEVAHGVRRMIGGKFKALQKAAMEVVGEKEWNERIEKKRKLNAYAEGKLAEEVTCDIVGEALNNKDALKRLAESLRGERGILARLRDAVAKMVEYFKNRGDKEGVRRMKAADKLLAEFESALKEGVAPEQVKPEDVDRSVRESRDEPENKRRKDFAERFGVDESYVSDYANGMAQKKTGKAARARRSMERQIYLANAGKTSKLSDIAKSLKPFRAALKEAFGDLDALIDEYRKLFEEERNMMEAARKKAEDEAAARKRHLDELSLLTDGQIDSRYAEALEKGDETEAREMLDEVARRKGYGDENNEYRMQHRAPSNPGYESDEARRNDIENGPDVNLEDIALGYNRQPDDYFTNPRGYGNDTPHGRESTDAVANALSSIRQGGRDVTVKVYRAVPTTMKEGKLRNGDWVTLSRRYAEMHGNHALNGKYRIMEDEVPAKDIWWDGNDVNEFGYDNGEDYKYKNVKNNRKSDDLVTRDDKGNVIPPSKRFNQRKADERYSRRESKALTAEERELRDNLVERMRKGGLDVVTDSEEMQRVIDTENERTRNKRSKKSEAARKRDEALYAVDWSTAFVSGKSREEATEIRRERGRKFKEETKELYGRVLSGNFDDVTLRLIDEFIDKSTPNNPYGRPLSKRLPPRVGQKMRGGERTGSIDALFSRISESAVGKDGKALPRAERERAIEEKKKELLKKWAIATGNWHTDIADFTDQREPIGSGTDSDVYLGKDGKSVIKVSKGKPYGKRFRPDVDNVALFNSVFRNSAYTIVGYGEVDGKFVRFLKQPIVDFTSSTPLTEGERVAYMEKLGFKPINKENTAFSNGEIIASDLQKSNIVKDKQGNVRVIDADMKLHTKDFGGKFSYPDAETDTRTDGVQRFLRTADGEVYGLVKDGRIYLDPKVATSETAVHEYTHLWGDMLRRKDSEQWSHTVKELKNSVLWEEVKELYPELKTDDEIADEVLSTFSGRRGAERLREEARRVADGEGGVFTKAKAIETLERVKEAIARFWEGVARMFGINRYRSAEELADMAMRDLLDSKNPMKDESGMRKRGEVGDEGVKSLKGEEAMVALDNIFEDKKTENMPQKVSSLVKFMELFRKPVRTFLGEVVNVKEEVYNKIIREKRTSISGAVLPTLENADFAIRDTDGSTLYIKRFKSENNDNVYNIAVVNKYGEVEDYVSSVHIKSDNNLRNKITKGAELLLPQERITDGILPRNNPTPTANVTNISEPSKPRYSRKPGESIFDYASRVSEDVDRSVRERVSARDEYEKKVKSKGFQTKETLQNSMLGLQEFMSAIDHASGNKRYIEDIPDFENPILGENRLSSVNKEEMHQVAKTQFKPLMSAVAKLSGNGKESGELYDYMFAKHGLERDAVMRQREAQKEFDKYQKANPKGTKTIGDFVASLEGKDYAGLTALTAEDGRVKSIQSQIDAIDEQMKATDDQLLLRKLGGQKKRLKVDLLNAARDAADDIRKTFENNPSHDRSDINELWSRVNEVNGNTLRKLYESGMLTKEAYNDISSMYTNYIPMRGFGQTTSADAYAYLTHGDSAFNAPIKTAKGRSSKADNPIAYMQAMAESAIMQGNRNVLVKQKMLNFVRNHPSDLASVSDVWLQYDSVADEWKPVFPDNIGANDSASVVAKKMEAFEDKMKQMAEKHPDLVQRSNEAPDIPYKVVEKGQLNEHQVLVKQNGKSYIITVNGSPRAAQAANGLTNPDTDLTGAVGKVFEGAEALNRQLSSLYTTLNPDFIGSNYVRDALYSNTMVYVKEGAKYGGSFNLNFAKYNPAEMANLYARYNKGSLDTSNETHRLFLEFMQNGGETGFVNLKQIEKRKSEIAKAIKRDGEISAAQIWGGLNDAIDFANRAVENSARFAAYVTSRKSGRSVGRSVYDAKEISVNFNRKGSGRNWWKDNVGTSRFYDTEIGLVEINRASVGSSLAHRYSQVKLDVITSLAEGFNNAVYFGSMQDFSRQEGVKSHYFAYPINYNGNRNYVFCRAMQDANKSRLYVHEVFLADNIEKGNTLQTAASQPHGGITLYKDILANVLAANVTNDSETSKPCFSRKPGESIFDYASRVSEDVDRSVCEGR